MTFRIYRQCHLHYLFLYHCDCPQCTLLLSYNDDKTKPTWKYIPCGRCDDEIEQRIGAASCTCSWSNEEVGIRDGREVKKSMEMGVYNAIALATLPYGCEACMDTTEKT